MDCKNNNEKKNAKSIQDILTKISNTFVDDINFIPDENGIYHRKNKNLERLFVFDHNDIYNYMNGTRKIDCATLARACESNELDFLKWCYKEGYKDEFDSTCLGYAINGKAIKVIEWLLSEKIINKWEESHKNNKMINELIDLNIDKDLLKNIPFY